LTKKQNTRTKDTDNRVITGPVPSTETSSEYNTIDIPMQMHERINNTTKPKVENRGYSTSPSGVLNLYIDLIEVL
jgi:hypothetical protein